MGERGVVLSLMKKYINQQKILIDHIFDGNADVQMSTVQGGLSVKPKPIDVIGEEGERYYREMFPKFEDAMHQIKITKTRKGRNEIVKAIMEADKQGKVGEYMTKYFAVGKVVDYGGEPPVMHSSSAVGELLQGLGKTIASLVKGKGGPPTDGPEPPAIG